MIIWIEDGVSTSINFNFRAWYDVEIRLNDDPRQKETIDGIIWLRRKKCIIYRLDIFSIAHVVQLVVSKMNFFCQRVNRRYPQRNMRWGIQNFIACQEAEKWQWLIDSMWHLAGMFGEIEAYAYGNAPNFELE